MRPGPPHSTRPTPSNKRIPAIAYLRIFLSTVHPRDVPASLTYASALVRPLAACMLPLMVASLVAVLQGHPVTPYLLWGFPTALLAASLWTMFNLRTRLAEVHVKQDAAALRTVWDCVHPPRPLTWQPVLDLRKGPSTSYVTLGHTSYELLDAEWPDLEVLLLALQQARHQDLPPEPARR